MGWSRPDDPAFRRDTLLCAVPPAEGPAGPSIAAGGGWHGKAAQARQVDEFGTGAKIGVRRDRIVDQVRHPVKGRDCRRARHVLHENAIALQIPIGLKLQLQSGLCMRPLSVRNVPAGNLLLGQMRGLILPVAFSRFAQTINARYRDQPSLPGQPNPGSQLRATSTPTRALLPSDQSAASGVAEATPAAIRFPSGLRDFTLRACRPVASP